MKKAMTSVKESAAMGKPSAGNSRWSPSRPASLGHSGHVILGSKKRVCAVRLHPGQLSLSLSLSLFAKNLDSAKASMRPEIKEGLCPLLLRRLPTTPSLLSHSNQNILSRRCHTQSPTLSKTSLQARMFPPRTCLERQSSSPEATSVRHFYFDLKETK